MPGQVRTKWRPALVLVLSGALAAGLVLPVAEVNLIDWLAPGMGRDQAIWVVAAGTIGVTLVLGWLLYRLILAPVTALSDAAEAIRAGAVARPIEHYGTREIAELGRVVLDMAEVLQARELAVRGYADHVTHELKTPLTAIRGAAELLDADETLSDDTRSLVGTIAGAEARAERLLSVARQIAAARTPEHRGATTLADCLPALRTAVPGLKISAAGTRQKLPLARSGLEIVLGHLASNAADAGATRLALEAGGGPEGPWLTVADNGPGISAGNAQHVFDPFFTTRRDDGGTGMGLAIVQTLFLAHGGRIVLEPGAGGAAFRISF